MTEKLEGGLIDSAPVLRVTQLDTAELDSALLLTLKHSIHSDYFKYIQHSVVQKYHTEIFAALKLVLWYHTYGKTGQTVSQSILDWSYQTRRMTLLKKALHCCFYCLDEWFHEKFLDLVKRLVKTWLRRGSPEEDAGLERRVDRLSRRLSTVFRVVSTLNFALFLYNGRFYRVWERVLDMRPVYARPQAMRQPLNSETMVREQLWHSYFSLFKVSDAVLDFSKLFAKWGRAMTRRTRVEVDTALCGICASEPTMAHRASPVNDTSCCQHVYCYHCIRQAVSDTSDHRYLCLTCDRYVQDVELFFKNDNI